MERAINLCDIGDRFLKSQRIKMIIEPYNRIYIGSYFCDRYFLMTTVPILKELEKSIVKEEIKISIVIPISSEENLEHVKKHVGNILRKYKKHIDTIVVNDMAMLEWVYERYDLHLVLGRLFSKALRDPRYLETLEKYEISKECTTIMKQFDCVGVEVEGCFQDIYQIDNDVNYKIYAHAAPFYISCMRPCFFASIPKEQSEKFIVNAKCELECSEYRLKNIINDNVSVHRIGKGVYFEHSLGTSLEQYADILIEMPIEKW